MNLLLYFALIFCGFGLILICWTFRGKFQASDKKKKKKNRKEEGKHAFKCPLCNSVLYPGENLITRIYKGYDAKEQSVTVHGCPYCYPVPKPGVERICPVCKQKVPVNGYLEGYLFLRDTGKRHVHIMGCTECHKRFKKN